MVAQFAYSVENNGGGNVGRHANGKGGSLRAWGEAPAGQKQQEDQGKVRCVVGPGHQSDKMEFYCQDGVKGC